MQSDNLDQIDSHHVLVIDSDDRILTRTSELLESAGYLVSTADMPDIGILRRVEPDVMVVGIFFREQPAGLNFLEHNLTDSMLAKVPVVIQGDLASLNANDRDRLERLPHPAVDTSDAPELLVQVRQVVAPIIN
jgi:CheY-like chemotaxis protein